MLDQLHFCGNAAPAYDLEPFLVQPSAARVQTLDIALTDVCYLLLYAAGGKAAALLGAAISVLVVRRMKKPSSAAK